MKAKESGDFKRDLPEAGTTVARCVKVLQLGTQEKTFKGEKKTQQVVRLVWELPFLMHQFKPDADEEPFRVSKEYNFSIHEKADFRKDIEKWANRELTNQEKQDGFDPKVLLGKTCQLTIAHEKGNDGNIYARVKAISPLLKEQKNSKGVVLQPAQVCPPAISEFIHFDFDESSTFKNWSKLFKNEKEKIRRSPEFSAIANQLEPPQNDAQRGNQQAQHVPHSEDIEDDLPF